MLCVEGADSKAQGSPCEDACAKATEVEGKPNHISWRIYFLRRFAEFWERVSTSGTSQRAEIRYRRFRLTSAIEFRKQRAVCIFKAVSIMVAVIDRSFQPQREVCGFHGEAKGFCPRHDDFFLFAKVKF